MLPKINGKALYIIKIAALKKANTTPIITARKIPKTNIKEKIIISNGTPKGTLANPRIIHLIDCKSVLNLVDFSLPLFTYISVYFIITIDRIIG